MPFFPPESVWCAVSQHTFIWEETCFRMGRKCRRPGSAQEENCWTLPWWQVLLLVIASSGIGVVRLSCCLMLHTIKITWHKVLYTCTVHGHAIMACVALDVNVFIFDTGPLEPMEKWLSKKIYFILQNKFQSEEHFVCTTSYTYPPLDLCFTCVYINERKKENMLTQ